MATKPIRIIAIAAFVCGIVQPTFSNAAPTAKSGNDGYPTLAGLSRVRAAGSTWGIVEIPHAVRVKKNAFGVASGFHVSGRGRIIGMGLVSTDSRVGYVQLQYANCWRAGCINTAGHQPELGTDWNTRDIPNPGLSNKPPPKRFTLPAGRYVLSLYADGAPVRATLRVPGLKGSLALTLHLPRSASEASPAVTEVGSGPATVATESVGAGRVGTNTILLGMAHQKDVGVQVHDEDWWCVYDQKPPGGASEPWCPGGSGVGIGETFITVNGGHGFGYGMFLESGPGATNGRVFQSVNDSGVEQLSNVHDNFLWADAGLPHQSA